MKRILGIDAGTNSLGWAVVDRDENGVFSLIDKGSLIFQEGVKIEKGVESSKASERTGYRSSRRHYFRRRLRKIEVLKVLVKYGWCPYLTDEDLKGWKQRKVYPLRPDFMEWQRTDEKISKNPYYYRHVCLNEKLDLSSEKGRFMLGRAIYHLAQRRGFLSNRLDQSSEDETGKVKKEISNLTQDMKNAGCDFLGEYFYMQYEKYGNRVRIRNRYTDREEHYRREFEQICKIQCLTEEQITELSRALYFQRPLKSQRQGVGKCTFEPTRQRCSDSHPDYERFRMLSFINNIKILEASKENAQLRPLNRSEIEQIRDLFFRKSKQNFSFEDIAKKIAGKNNYRYIKDEGFQAFAFNYRMTQSVSGCPTIQALKSIFGEDYERGIAERYLKGNGKDVSEMVNDVWNVIYSFADDEHLIRWGKENLQLTDKEAASFAKIPLSHSFASISLHAIRKILPWLERGFIYSHAVLMAKIPDIVGKEIWQNRGEEITAELSELICGFNAADTKTQGTLEMCIKDYLLNNFDLRPGAVEKLYHPSMIETYPDAQPDKDGIFLLGSPRTNAVRNPMAMRSLHEIRKVVNMLLKKRIINRTTEVHIEYARELNDANRRAAISRWNNERENLRKKYAAEIVKVVKEATGRDIVPTDTDILRYELWEEQGHKCLYTGEEIGITDFICENPKYDIEHTVPRSQGGDSTRENLTLCSSKYNRDVKKSKLPSELANYHDIIERIRPWKEKIEKLQNEVDKIVTFASMAKPVKDSKLQKRHKLRLELDYWREKYRRFEITEADQGFSRRQGAGIGLVGKYAGLYLKSLFHDPQDRAKTGVRVVKGTTTAEFRKMWGLQDIYEKKSRDNHIHHCIDAIVIACITPGDHSKVARYYRDLEAYEIGQQSKPIAEKPWATFTEDLLNLEKEILVVHDTKNNLIKRAKKRKRLSDGTVVYEQGDSARGALHNETLYGAIERDGKIQYVVRKPVSSLTPSDFDKIVDDAVRGAVKAAYEFGGKEALSGDIWLNKEKGVKIKKVRVYATSVTKPLHIRQHRDVSVKEYKRQVYVANDSNYIMAIYEGEVKGKPKRDFQIFSNIQAADYCRKSRGETKPMIPEVSKNGFPLKWTLKVGQHVILYENSPEEINFDDVKDVTKRLYYVTGMSILAGRNVYGRIVMKHHQEARKSSELHIENSSYKNNHVNYTNLLMLHTQIKALVEGIDFEITALGEIKRL